MRNYYNKFFSDFLFLILMLFLGLNVTSAGQGTSYNKIVFFGDSLSDNGNLFFFDLGFLPKSPPYFDGRFSNGYVWSEHVAKHFYDKNFTSSVNYAIGGETAVFHNPRNGFLPYSLTMSLNSYLLRSMMSDRAKTLFIIWIGSNDYLKGADNVESLTSAVVKSIQETIESLIYHGGINFLIINLPDIAKTPYGRVSDYNKILHALSVAHNTKLEKIISQIKESYKMININMYDAGQHFEHLLKNLDHYNIKYRTQVVNVANACWEGSYTLDKNKYSESNILMRLNERIHKQQKPLTKSATMQTTINPEELAHAIAYSPDLTEAYIITEKNSEGVRPCGSPNAYLFWDRIHPSAIMHMMLSHGIIEFIEQNFGRPYAKEVLQSA